MLIKTFLDYNQPPAQKTLFAKLTGVPILQISQESVDIAVNNL